MNSELEIEDAILADPGALGFPSAAAIRRVRVSPDSGVVDLMLLPDKGAKLVLIEVKDERNRRSARREPFTPVEARCFLSAVQDHRPDWYPFFLTALSTGMRIGELLAMKWKHVEWKSATYHVAENLTRARTFDTTKTIGSDADVSLPPPLLVALTDHKARQAEQRLRCREWPYPELVFPNSRGKPFDHHTVSAKVFKGLLSDAGLRDIRFHDLRHATASLMIAAGANIKAVQRQLRHASATLTLDTYGHLYPDDRSAAAEQLGRVLCG